MNTLHTSHSLKIVKSADGHHGCATRIVVALLGKWSWLTWSQRKRSSKSLQGASQCLLNRLSGDAKGRVGDDNVFAEPLPSLVCVIDS